MTSLPCIHLNTDIDQDGACEIGRKFPEECLCRSYQAINAAERQPCEVWSRVMGYHRPTSMYNSGKQQEHKDRKFFRESATEAAGRG